MTYYHITEKLNIDSILSIGLIPQIGIRSIMCESIPKIFLFSNQESMFDAVGSWFGELFDDSIELSIIEVYLPDNWQTESDVDFEISTKILIPAKYLKYIKDI